MSDSFEARMDAQVDKVIEAAINTDLWFRGFREGSCKDGEFRDTVNLLRDPEAGGEFNPLDVIVTYPDGEWFVDNGGQRVPYGQTGWAESGYPVARSRRRSRARPTT